ncbi:27977_t:CDS:2 [Dentiscutata erythropus]|uniref:27977_t:CDS:1 n=1 Tax=Dentiscutata erythropus TaxID=1348616 RepID=A0A9N9K5A6_9GLOM|nr:27977_t:CDS:2 [Dentiscutata erythropus]
MNSSISIPQPKILPIHSLSSARNPEQVISLRSNVQARMENLQEYKKQLQAES